MVSSSENKPVKLEEMSYHKLSRLIKKLSSIKKKKYKRCKETKYGNINRGFKLGMPSFTTKIAMIGVAKTSVHQVKTDGLTPFRILLLKITEMADIKDVANAI